MVLDKKERERAVHLFPQEAAIFEILSTKGASNSVDVNAQLGGHDLLQTMRLIHQLEQRGLLIRVLVNGKNLFQIKPKIKSFKVFTRPKTLNDKYQ